MTWLSGSSPLHPLAQPNQARNLGAAEDIVIGRGNTLFVMVSLGVGLSPPPNAAFTLRQAQGERPKEIGSFPFMLSLSKHEHTFTTPHQSTPGSPRCG